MSAAIEDLQAAAADACRVIDQQRERIKALESELASAVHWNHRVRVCAEHTEQIVMQHEHDRCVICELDEAQERGDRWQRECGDARQQRDERGVYAGLLAGLLREAVDHLAILSDGERDDPDVGIRGWDDCHRVVAEARAALAQAPEGAKITTRPGGGSEGCTHSVAGSTPDGNAKGFESPPCLPTSNMVVAGFECEAFDALMDAVSKKGGWPYSCKEAAQLVTEIYRAMIEAAPRTVPGEGSAFGFRKPEQRARLRQFAAFVDGDSAIPSMLDYMDELEAEIDRLNGAPSGETCAWNDHCCAGRYRRVEERCDNCPNRLTPSGEERKA